MAAFGFDGCDGIAGGPSGRKHTLDDDDREAGEQATFDPLSGAVIFRLLANSKGVEELAAPPRGERERVRDGVGAESETANRARHPPADGQTVESQPSDDREAVAGHRSETRIDIKRGPSARREDEIAMPYGTGEEQILEGVSEVVVIATTIHCACRQCSSARRAGRANGGRLCRP